jgi:hypothetical protein
VPPKVRKADEPQGDLFITVENEDWVATHGTRADLVKLGQAMLDLANSEGSDGSIGNDAVKPVFRQGSLGYIVYRHRPGWRAAAGT